MTKARLLHKSEFVMVKKSLLLDHFCAEFGYKERDSIQIRLECDGGMVYISDHRESTRLGDDRLLSVVVSFEFFQKEWRDFVRYMKAKKEDEVHDG